MNKSDGNRIKVGVELINIDIDKLKAKGLKLFLTLLLQSHRLPLPDIIHSIDNNPFFIKKYSRN
jgi:phosphotransferase system IIA component